MILNIRSWDENTDSFNDWAEEGNFISYIIDHRFNEPATATIKIADPTGSIMQKYDVDTTAHEIFVGPGEVTIEDPNETDIFVGRIVKVRYDKGIVTMLAKDISDQLSDDLINYDTREDLDGAGLRQSTLHMDYDGDAEPALESGGHYYVVDANMSWAVDQWNGMFFGISLDNAGTSVTYSTGPTSEVTSATAGLDTDDFQGGRADIYELWTDNANYHRMVDDDESWSVIYRFPSHILQSSLFNSFSSSRLRVIYLLNDNGNGGYAELALYDDGNAAWISYGTEDEELYTKRLQYTCSLDAITDIISVASDDIHVRISPKYQAGSLQCYVYQILLELTCDMDPYDGLIGITDTVRDSDDGGATYHTLHVDTDVSKSGLGCWEGMKYYIVDYIHHHINGLVTGNDILEAMTTSVESTTGVVAINFKERSTMDILKQLADYDQAVFWVDLGTKQLTWKKSFVGAGTGVTDATFINIGSEWDYESMFNEHHVYGIRLGNEQIYINSEDIAGGDPGSTSKDKYVLSKGKVLRSQAILSQDSAENVAAALVNAEDEVNLYLRATIAGLAADGYRLGDELKITSTMLGLVNAVYVITHWSYDSNNYTTTIRLAPQSAVGYNEHLQFGDKQASNEKRLRTIESSIDVQSLTGQTF